MYVFAILFANFDCCVFRRVDSIVMFCFLTNNACQLSSIGIIEVCLLSCYQMSQLSDSCLSMINLSKFEGAGLLDRPNMVGDIVSDMQFCFLPFMATNL